MNSNQLKAGTILSYMQMALNIVINLLYTPIMLKTLGKGEYGLYQTITSTISMLSLLSLGFNASYIRYFSKYKIKNDINAIQRLNGLFFVIFSIIGLIAFICGMFITFNLNIVFDNGLTADEYSLAKILMFISTINLAIMFPMSVFQNIIAANERFVVLKSLGMLKTVFSPLLCMPLLLMGFRSISIVSVTLIVSIFTDCIYVYYVIRVLHNRFLFNRFDSNLVKSLFVYTSFIAINLIVDQINLNIDKILLGRFRGTGETALYSVGFTIYHMYQSFSASISSVFTPRIHKIVNETKENINLQKTKLTEIFVKVGRIQFMVLGLIASGIVFWGRTFIVDFWAGREYGNSYIVAIMLILSSSIALIQNIGIEIQRALNKHRFRSIVYLIMAFLNLGLSIILCKIYGAVGSAFGTAISLIVANGIIMNIYYNKQCNINIVFFWKNIFKMSIGLVPPIIFGIVITNIVDTTNILLFLCSIIVYSIVYFISVWLISMNDFEKEILIKPIYKLIKHNN